jgi:hypothetical protein
MRAFKKSSPISINSIPSNETIVLGPIALSSGKLGRFFHMLISPNGREDAIKIKEKS